jgi:hypothetical protein
LVMLFKVKFAKCIQYVSFTKALVEFFDCFSNYRGRGGWRAGGGQLRYSLSGYRAVVEFIESVD